MVIQPRVSISILARSYVGLSCQFSIVPSQQILRDVYRRILESGTIFRAIAKSDDVERAIKVRSIRPYNTKVLFYIYLYLINS